MFVHAALCVLSLSFSGSVPSAPVSVAGISNGARIIDDAPEIAKLVETFEESLRSRTGGRGRDLKSASLTLHEFHRLFSRSGPKDRDLIVKMVVRGIERFDVAVPSNQQFLLDAARALEDMGPESVQPLTELVVSHRIEDDVTLHRQLVLSLGRTRHVDALATLQKLLYHEHATIEATSAEALGEFQFHAESQRKELFYVLLGRLLDAKGMVEQDDFDSTTRRHYDTVVGAMTTSLKRLSGRKLSDPEAWQRFWNKNKNKPWGASTPGA